MIPCVSAIAWHPEEAADALAMLASLGIRDVELAPNHAWPDAMQVTETEARELAATFAAQGFRVRSFQALLFGKSELQLFDDGKCEAYLTQLCRLAGWMGAGALVFGSPKNRLRGALSTTEANARACEIFRRIGAVAHAAGTAFCVEANPAVYGGDFLLTSGEVVAMVQAVNSPGLKLNVDLGEIALNQLPLAHVLPDQLRHAGHLHVSEPMLEPFNAGREAHREAAEILTSQGYAGAVSLEMKRPAGGLPALQQATRAMLQAYFPSPA